MLNAYADSLKQDKKSFSEFFLQVQMQRELLFNAALGGLRQLRNSLVEVLLIFLTCVTMLTSAYLKLT